MNDASTRTTRQLERCFNVIGFTVRQRDLRQNKLHPSDNRGSTSPAILTAPSFTPLVLETQTTQK
ncbi:hypothetical protein M513_12912 [Trichuris suis]|uniref:Uncharacterized protein n=1 Tax=Trichuris suis TaxID=68888 RepID=A0A085LML6_9BILA|nr:hypothetical protein M513_12912 [Trichuris suis]